jgi:ABC-type lipoprotein release transport system permease subunit
VGLFGVLSYITAQRTTEIGICIALGAKREHVMRKILLDAMRPAARGLVVGLAASLEAGRLMRDLLYEIKPLDPAVLPQLPQRCSRWPGAHASFPRGVQRASILCKH